MVETGLLPLADAHARYTDNGGTTPLSSWQKRSREYSSVEVGRSSRFAAGSSTKVQTEKIGGRWYVTEPSFTAALRSVPGTCVSHSGETYLRAQAIPI